MRSRSETVRCLLIEHLPSLGESFLARLSTIVHLQLPLQCTMFPGPVIRDSLHLSRAEDDIEG